MDASGTKWMKRKGWHRLVELPVEGCLSCQEQQPVAERLAWVRGPVSPKLEAQPTLWPQQGGGVRPAPRYLTPSTKEVESSCGRTS